MNYTVLERMRNAQIPEYNKWMYLQGYKPWVIRESARNSIISEHEQVEEPAPTAVIIRSEVKTI